MSSVLYGEFVVKFHQVVFMPYGRARYSLIYGDEYIWCSSLKLDMLHLSDEYRNDCEENIDIVFYFEQCTYSFVEMGVPNQ